MPLPLLSAIERYLDVLRVWSAVCRRTRCQPTRATCSVLPILDEHRRHAAPDVTTLQARRALAFAVRLSGRKLSLRSQARMLSSLRGFGKFLRRENLVSVDPMAELILPKLGRPLCRTRFSSQIEELTKPDVPELPRGARDAAMIEVLYSTGRVSARLCKLALADIGPGFVRTVGKGRKTRVVPLGERAT